MQRLKAGLIGIIGEEAKQDFWGAMQKIAEIGYQGVEGGTEKLLEGDRAANLKRLHELGLKVITVSAGREQLRDSLDQVIDEAHALQVPHVSVWWAPCDSREAILADAELYNAAGARLKAEGLKLCYHNHEHEIKTTFHGVCALDVLAEHTDPQALYFEPDIAWLTFGGEDPALRIRKMAGRIPAIHVKDLARLDERDHFTAVGTGIVKIREAVQAAAETGVEWAVVEQDRLHNLTAFETATAAYLNLKETGLV